MSGISRMIIIPAIQLARGESEPDSRLMSSRRGLYLMCYQASQNTRERFNEKEQLGLKQLATQAGAGDNYINQVEIT